MKYTSKYKLKKPDYTDTADIATQNENADIIDEQLSVIDFDGRTKNGVLGFENGGTGATSESGARANLKTNLRTYIALSQIGLTSSATILEIATRLEDNSSISFPVSQDNELQLIPPNAKVKYGAFSCIRISDSRIFCKYMQTASGDYGTVGVFECSVRLVGSIPVSDWEQVYPVDLTDDKLGGLLPISKGGTGANSISAAKAALQISDTITGFYTGDGVNGRIISLGVTPRAVICSMYGERFASMTEPDAGGALAVTGSPAGATSSTPSLEIVSGGFKVYEDGGSEQLNDSGKKYNYVAWT